MHDHAHVKALHCTEATAQSRRLSYLVKWQFFFSKRITKQSPNNTTEAYIISRVIDHSLTYNTTPVTYTRSTRTKKMVASCIIFCFRATNQQNLEKVIAHHHTEHLPQASGKAASCRSLISNRLHQAATFLEVTELIMVVKSGACEHQEIVKHSIDRRLYSSEGVITTMLLDEYTVSYLKPLRTNTQES